MVYLALTVSAHCLMKLRKCPQATLKKLNSQFTIDNLLRLYSLPCSLESVKARRFVYDVAACAKANYTPMATFL